VIALIGALPDAVDILATLGSIILEGLLKE
jgi:hypothetical protein